MKKLERSRENTVIAGVCTGLAEYYNMDPVIFRIAFIIMGLIEGIGIIAYIVCWIAIPQRKKGEVAAVTVEGEETPTERSEFYRLLPGIALIVIGLVFFVRVQFLWFDVFDLWPLALIGLGGVLIFASLNKKQQQEHADERG